MLYQLSYASPIHPKNRPGHPKARADTLNLRTYYGTEIKVSTPPPEEQTATKNLQNEACGGAIPTDIPAPVSGHRS